MARRHPNESAEEDRSYRSGPDGKTSFLKRRTFLTVAGAGALAGVAGAVGRGRAAEVDLGSQGLSPGDNIDGYIREHWTDGSTVYIPPGEYETMMSWWDTDVRDATLRGDPAGVTLRRADDPPTWSGGGENITGRMHFDGHVVVENITFEGQLGQEKEKFDVTGRSDGAHLELRNFNVPDGGMGCGDSYIGRARGDGQVTYKWCYFGPTANTAFYQTANASETGSIRQVFDGCTFHNNIQAWRGGTRDYTIRNCLYVVDGPAPSWSDSGGGDPNGSECWGGGIRPFKMDQDFQFDGRVENLHFWITEPGRISRLMDWQSDQPGTSGSMDGIFVYTEGSVDMGNWSSFDDWSMTNVHVTGGGSLNDVAPQATNVYTGSDAVQANSQTRVWSPGGQGLGYLTRPDGGSSEPPADDEPAGSVFEVISTTQDANLQYTFTVDGTASATETEAGVSSIGESNDVIVENGDGTTTVTGQTGMGYGDAYEVNGDVTTFERTGGESDFQLLLDGDDVTADLTGEDAPTEPEASTFEIVSDSGAELTYTFDVEGTAERADAGDGNSSVGESNDTITDNGDGTVTVSGKTGFGYGDAYSVTGPISNFERTGGEAGFQLLLDGVDVTDDLAGVQRVLVDGTAAPDELNAYRIEVSGEIQPDPENTRLVDGGLEWDAMDDIVDGSTAVGVVGNGVDAYTYTGEVVDVEVDGGATAEVQD